MQHNIILAGVGGQGILAIAQAISHAALRRGMHVKQSEVHGMAQRGGAVQAHLRISDEPIYSDLIPLGKADMLISVEPLEALRYLQYLRPEGVAVVSTDAYVNIMNYPPLEGVLDRIGRLPHHVLLDANRLAQSAGSSRAANVLMLGAASVFLSLEVDALTSAVDEMFAAKGEKIVDANRRAFALGRAAAMRYRDLIRWGGRPRVVRDWTAAAEPNLLLSDDAAAIRGAFESFAEDGELSAAEIGTVARLLDHIRSQGRDRLFEHEVYSLVELVGAISPPRYAFVPAGSAPAPEELRAFSSDRVVLKLVSPDVVHKSDAKAVVFCRNDADIVTREIQRLVDQHRNTAHVEGVLIVECVEHDYAGFGSELFVGIRASREFGPVIAAGLGGIDTEYLAAQMRPGKAVAKAVALDTTPERFFEQFRQTAAYDVLSGRARGHHRIVSDGELLHCFRAFLALARHFCVAREDAQPALVELEVNPFAFRQQHMVPLDGRGRLGGVVAGGAARPLDKLPKLLEPRSIAVLGVSSTAVNFGRIIVRNIKACGFPTERLFVIKDGDDRIDGVRCVANVAALPKPVDLLVVAAGGDQLPDIIEQTVASGKVHTCCLIPGGVGETEGTEELKRRVRAAILAGRERPDGGSVFIGPNCLGVQSRVGHYDTFFIPEGKHDKRWSAPPRRVALISQSGAFIVSRLSNLEYLDPALAVSLGNQLDVTLADVLAVVARRDDIDVIGTYVEGFNDLDGLEFLHAIAKATRRGKMVIFYKAGRTESGRSAAAGHTASLAGDYDVCQSAAAAAGAVVVDTFKEFEQLVELATALHGKQVAGRRVAAITNAGCESVAMADAIRGPRYRVETAPLSDKTRKRLADVLAAHKLHRLVNASNPLDLTPMAGESTYVESARVLLEAEETDALVIATVPLTPALMTTADELQREGSLAHWVPKLFAESTKPVIFVVDSGELYTPLARRVRAAGVPVFRSCDQAIRSLGRYLCQRTRVMHESGEHQPTPDTGQDAVGAESSHVPSPT